MIRSRGALVAASSLAVVAGLLVGTAPIAAAAQPPAALPAAAPTSDELGSESERRGERIVDLRGGVCARAVPLGMVRLKGPGGTRLVARVRAQGEAKLLTIVSGSGRIGQANVRPRDVSGELAWRKGEMTGSVTISLPEHVKVSRTWTQDVTVTAQPQGCDWAATVALQARGAGAALDLRGPLAENGSYVLRGSGSVGISRTKVPVTGFLRATAPGRAASTTWQVSGSTPRVVRIPGVRLDRVRVELSSALRVPHGTASLRLDAPLLTAPAILEVAGADTWSAQVNGSNRRLWVVPKTDQVVVRTSELKGAVGVRAGRPHWTLTAPGAARIGTLDYSVDVGFAGRLTYTVQARAAVGTFLGMPESRSFLGVPTKLTIAPEGITGALTVVTRGEILLDLPTVWRGTTDYILRPVPGQGWSFTPYISHALRAGKGTMRLTGPVSPTGGVQLVASGDMDVSGTTIPVRGYYNRTSFTDGSLPSWSLVGEISKAEGGRIPLDGGAGFVGGRIVWTGDGSQDSPAQGSSERATPRVNITTVPTAAGSGETTIQLSDVDDDTFYLPVTYVYTDPSNWTATVAGTTPSNLYNPFTGLEIPETDFSGTVSDVSGKQTWDVSITMQDWQDMAIGVDYKGAFTISNTCPLANADECPSASGIFIGGTSTMLFDDTTIPEVDATGAFLTDLSWARWDATTPAPVTFLGITMTDPDVTVWRGERSDTNPLLVLPDLSDLNGNGMNVEFCADFTVEVPYVDTLNTYGCAEWSDEGVVMGQVNTGGSVATGDYNGVTVNGTTLTGYATNGIDGTQTIFLDGVEIQAEKGEEYLTAQIEIPGNAMNDFGTGTSADTMITAEGRFDDEGNFLVEGTIPVNLKGGGFTLEEIVVSVSREKGESGEVFDLEFDAESDVVISGNHFPLDIYIGYEKAGDSTITVGMSATGTQSTQPEGTMDFINLVPTGDFEPENASIVDGSFDGKLPDNIPNDGGFERSTNPGDIVVNGGFDDSMGQNVMPDGDFESGVFGNMLANSDFEDTNVLVNGDFEENGGSTWGWTSPNLPFPVVAGSAVGPDDTGNYMAQLMSPGFNGNNYDGPWQYIEMTNLNGADAEWSMWVTSATSGSTSFEMQMTGLGCSSFTQYKNTQTVSSSAWVEMTVGGDFGAGCNGLLLGMYVTNANTGVYLDAGEVAVTTSNSISVPATWRPNVVGTFDSLSTSPLKSGYSSNVTIATDYPKTLQTNGASAWMTSNYVGSTSGSFDISYSVMFPTGTSSREIADFGFWLDGNYSTMNGYCFRLQTANGDGGFLQCNKNSKTHFTGPTYAPDVTRGDWYRVRLISTGQAVSAYVTNTTTGEFFFSDTIYLAGKTPYGGYFGQVPEASGTTQGIRWDDLTYNWLENVSTSSSPGPAQPSVVWLGTNSAHSGTGRASLYSGSTAGMPFQYSTGETPVQGATYAYSAWVRAASGSVSGSLTLAATGNSSASDQVVSTPFSVGTTWTEVQVTLTNAGGGYTDLRPGIILNSANVELYLDDQVLQQVPWQYNTGTPFISVTDDVAHSGTNSLQLINPSSSTIANAFYQFPQLPAPGSEFTASAWVMSPAGVNGSFFIFEESGTTVTNFVGTGTWQQVSVTRTMQGGDDYPDIVVNIGTTGAGQPLYVDDVSLIVSQINSNEGGYVGAPSPPAGWLSSTDALPISATPKANPAGVTPRSLPAPGNVSASSSSGSISVTWSPVPNQYEPEYYQVRTTLGQIVCKTVTYGCSFSGLAAGSYAFQVRYVSYLGEAGPWSTASNTVAVYQNVAPVVVDDPSLARSAPGALVMQPGPGGTEINTYTVTPETAPAVGSTWQASVWLAPSTANNSQPVTVTVSAGNNSKSATVTLPTAAGEYVNAIVPLAIASAASSFTVTLSYSDSSGTRPVYVDDLSITEVGLTPVDAWTPYAPTGFLGIEGVNDPTNAYAGDGYLQVTNNGTGGGAAYLESAYRPVAGTAHEMSFWVKSPKGTISGAYAWLRTQNSSGANLDSYQASIPVTGTWQQVFLSLPIKDTSAVNLITEFDLPPGATIWVDNVESRDVNYWSAAQPSSGVASITIIDNAPDAANGQNYLRFSSGGSGGGVSDVITADTSGNPIDVIAGSSYKLEAYVRSTTGATVTGTMSLATGNGSTPADGTGVTFTAGSSWTPVELMLDTTKNANTMFPKIVLNSAGLLDVDELTLIPVLIEQSDPWSASGSGVTWGVYDDPANAYDSSYGVMEFSVATAGTGVQHAATQSTSVGDHLSATAFVRTGGASVSGTLQVTSVGGTKETWQQPFTANGEWQMVSIPITIAQSGHTGFTVAVLLNTTGRTLYLDQVALQTNPWTANAGAVQSIVFDGAAAQSGSGYLNLARSGSGSGSTYLDMAASSDIGGTYAAGSTWIATVYVRSSSATLATGSVSLGASSGTPTTQAFSVGSDWTAIPVSYTVGSTALDSLRVTVTVNGGSVPIEVDSVSISDGTPPPDGITTPLPHPESGWIYLWDEAFGIPGMHLWAISAQVDVVSGLPGLGVSATTYQDPTKMPHVMTGTDWMKGDMAFNISESDPCLLFDFESDGGNSGVSLGQGVFTANDFSINFAPRGCQVGPYTLPKGASLSFDGELGDGTVNFDIAITEGDDGPEFTEDIGITDITIGGFDFKEMELSILLTETDDSITFVGDMVTPMGNFNGSYDLDANESGLVMDGSVSLTDWGWTGGGFDVEEFDYSMEMTVPFGAGQCGSFDDTASGLMDMAKKTSLSFTGRIAMNCGKLEILEMDYDYKHGSITEVFELDYDASTGILAGEVEFDFDRSTSWKFFFHHFNRHPKFSIKLAFSMNVDKPSTASATLDGTVSVSGGDGSLECTLQVGSGSDWADDQCSLHVHISVGGGHTYNASW